jgi:hypothetical protein
MRSTPVAFRPAVAAHLRAVRASAAVLVSAATLALLGACADAPVAPLHPTVGDEPARLLVPLASAMGVSAGGEHACTTTGSGAFIDAGTVTCWGGDWSGQATVPAGLGRVTQVSAGSNFTCALTAAGAVTCWGNMDKRQTSVPSAAQSGVTQVSAGTAHACALDTGGTVTCWGSNESGQAAVPAWLSGVTDVAAGFGVTQVSAGTYHTCAVTGAGGVACWGASGRATVPAGLSGITQVSAGRDHTCAVGTGGTVTCWGGNDYGQATVPAGLTGVSQVSAGWAHTCALMAGEVKCWGTSYLGATSVPSAARSGVTHVSAGLNFTCAVGARAAVTCWGANQYGQSTVPATHVPAIHVDPTGIFSAASSAAVAGQPLTLTLASAQVLGYPAATQFSYAFDCGDGTGLSAFGPAATRTCTPATAGARTVRGALRDEDGDTQEYTLIVSVTDPTPPVVTRTVTGTVGTNGWYRGDVAVAWTAADAESGITALNGCGQTSVTADTPGLTLTCAATSAGGTTTQSVTVKRDGTAPALTAAVSPGVVVQHGTAAAAATASDATSGLAGAATCGVVSTALAGARTVTCTATDHAGNTASAAAGYTVVSVTPAVEPIADLSQRTGVVTVTGTATCSGAITVPVTVTLTQAQRSGRGTTTVSGTGQGTATCTGSGPATWTATVVGAGAGSFGTGAATAVAVIPGTSPAVAERAGQVQLR